MSREELIAYCLTFPDAYEDYPFDGEWAVMRHRGNQKSFALIYEREGKLCVNLKCEPMRADFLRGAFADVTPAYHMNKQHWNTILMGGDVPYEELCEMVLHSHELTRPKPKRQKKQ